MLGLTAIQASNSQAQLAREFSTYASNVSTAALSTVYAAAAAIPSPTVVTIATLSALEASAGYASNTQTSDISGYATMEASVRLEKAKRLLDGARSAALAAFESAVYQNGSLAFCYTVFNDYVRLGGQPSGVSGSVATVFAPFFAAKTAIDAILTARVS